MGEKANSSQTTKSFGCFICNVPHRERDYPKTGKLNALIATKEDHNKLETSIRVNSFHLLNVIQA